MHVVLTPISGGYVFRSAVGFSPSKTFELKAEKSGKRRVFKTVDSALRVCKQVGFTTVQVQL